MINLHVGVLFCETLSKFATDVRLMMMFGHSLSPLGRIGARGASHTHWHAQDGRHEIHLHRGVVGFLQRFKAFLATVLALVVFSSHFFAAPARFSAAWAITFSDNVTSRSRAALCKWEKQGTVTIFQNCIVCSPLAESSADLQKKEEVMIGHLRRHHHLIYQSRHTHLRRIEISRSA